MRILDLTTLYIDGGEGGVNTYLREKARYLACLPDISHTIVVPGAKTDSEILEGATLHRVKSPPLPRNPQHRVLLDFSRLRQLVRDAEPDVVEVDCSYFLGHVARRALAGRPVPIVGFYHAHLPMLYARPVRNLLRQGFTRHTTGLAWRYARYCARPCARMVVSSQFLAERLRGRGFPTIDHVPLGVNLELFRPPPAARRPRIPGVPKDRDVVLFVGRLSPEKELELLLCAHGALRDRRRASGERVPHLVIAGDGPQRRRVERLAASDETVTYLGMCDYGPRLAELYQSADVLAAPGRSETFGLIVLEAFACGLPVVAVNQGGPAELVAPELGALASPGDVGDFSAKLEGVLARQPDRTEIRAHVQENFAWESTFARLLEIYGRAGAARSAAPTPLARA